jgi:hypothetical protein
MPSAPQIGVGEVMPQSASCVLGRHATHWPATGITRPHLGVVELFIWQLVSSLHGWHPVGVQMGRVGSWQSAEVEHGLPIVKSIPESKLNIGPSPTDPSGSDE